MGAKVLTLKQALLLLVFLNWGVFMGSHVTNTVEKKIVDIDIFENNPGALMYGILCTDLSSAIWLTIAAYFKLPLSLHILLLVQLFGFSLAYEGAMR